LGYIFLWLHIISAATYVGGMIFIATALVPFARRLDVQERSQLIAGIGKKFRVVSWIAIGVLIVSGFAMLGTLGMTSQITSNSSLLWKLILFVTMIILTILHDIVAGSQSKGNSTNVNMRAFSSWTGRITLILGLIVIYLATQIRLDF
jgi:uncharacterized membrane protein